MSEMFSTGIATNIDWPPILWVLQSPYWGFLLTCLLAATVLRRNPLPSRTLFALDIASGIFMAVAIALVSWSVFVANPLVAFLGMNLGGLGIAWEYVRWGQCFSQITVRQSFAYICFSDIAACIIKIILFYSAPVLHIALGIILALVSAKTLHACTTTPHPEPSAAHAAGDQEPRLSDFWMLPAGLALLSGLQGIISAARFSTFGGSDGFQIPLSALLEIAIVAMLWSWMCVLNKSINLINIMITMIIVMSTGIALLAVMGDGASELAFLFTNTDHSLLTLFLWLVLADLSKKFPHNPIQVFAIGWIYKAAPVLLGGALAKIIDVRLSPSVCCFLLYLTCMAFIVVIKGRNTSTSKIFDELNSVTPTKQIDFEKTCQELSASYHLTGRESEVLRFLAQGKTQPYIAETLDISENTVRVYTKRIYSKLDVHSRSELLLRVYDSPVNEGR